jgi:hypothetical protein
MSKIDSWEIELVKKAIQEAREFATVAKEPSLVEALHQYADALQESLEKAMS